MKAFAGKWKLFPSLTPPDWGYWESLYPNGMGASTFSAPAWQRLMCEEETALGQLMFLQGRSSDGRILSLPVFVQTNRWRRYEINVRPVAYSVMPIEGGVIDDVAVGTILGAAESLFTAGFTWWLPPWSSFRQSTLQDRAWQRCLKCSSVDTYLITLRGSVEKHLIEEVTETQRYQVRSSYRRGLEVLSNPPADVVNEYYQLYTRVWENRGWTGRQFSARFFHGVATQLQQGGELLVMRLNGRVVGGGVLLFDRYAVHYFQGTTDRDTKGVFPHSVLIDMALRRAESLGVTRVNLGGVDYGNIGLIHFKMFWGARSTPVPIVMFHYGRGRAPERLAWFAGKGQKYVQ
ncbi:MAG: GNAT family N-acetyltransferase [Phycisphaerae bacterium]|nr:GNAT family N-acetyltransferase [Phycisphaerae bacterium]